MDQGPTPTQIEPPRGTFSAHVDEKGRLKLPVAFQEYLRSFGDDRLYITSMDTRTGRVYPLSVWKENEKVLEELSSEDPVAADSLFTIANKYGGEAKVDPQGRVMLPTDLRRELSLENQEVRLDCSRKSITVYSMAEYEARLSSAKSDLAEKLIAAKRKGLK